MGGDTEGQIRLPYIGIYEKFSSKLFIEKGTIRFKNASHPHSMTL